MLYQDQQVEELSDEMWTDLSMHYLTIDAEIRRKKIPPLEKNYIRLLKERYQLEVTEEELAELKDYAENYYSDAVIGRINYDLANGMQPVRRY